jgi:hypothetical protein
MPLVFSGFRMNVPEYAATNNAPGTQGQRAELDTPPETEKFLSFMFIFSSRLAGAICSK